MINAIVLAAGESKRMGMPKPLLRFPRRASVPARLCGRSRTTQDVSCGDARPTKSGDTTFLEQIVSVLQRSEVGRIMVVLGSQAPMIRASIDLSGADVVINENYHEGQLSSLVAGLKSLPPAADAILLCLVDNPFVTVGSVDGVVGAFGETGKPIVVPVFNGRRGHPALFARPMFDELLNAPLEKGARHVVQSNEDKVFEVQIPDPGILARIDTPEDYFSHFGVAPRIMER
ncbi:MAG: nucleotidyltransferase family protein [Phycisphaerae bacterium]|nr:nucleotidyltransferase family protein [Phycisphaerae bacterium]